MDFEHLQKKLGYPVLDTSGFFGNINSKFWAVLQFCPKCINWKVFFVGLNTSSLFGVAIQ